MQINQVVVAAAPGDAVTNSALAYRRLLREIGPSEIYAQHIDAALAGDVLDLARFDERGGGRPPGPDDVLILHGSIGAPEVFSFVVRRPERLVLVYHNVSPAAMYQEYDPAVAGLLESGRRDIARLADRTVLAMAPSAFNAHELAAMGYRDVRLCPLVVDVEELLRLPDDSELASSLGDVGGPILLHVGQVLPHKSPERLVQAFHVLSTYLRPDATLLLVGASRSPAFRRRFDRFVADLRLPGLRLLGAVTDAQLATCFRAADVFVTASSHEGFCVPVIEAMAFGLPVVARACGAIPETLGDAGLLLPQDAGPLLYAEAVERVLDDPALRQELVVRGTARLDHFRPDDARAAFVRNVLSVVG